MFSLLGASARMCDGLTRREWLRIGGLGTLGLSLPTLLQARDTAPAGVLPTDKTWLRITRKGDNFTGAASPDGQQ